VSVQGTVAAGLTLNQSKAGGQELYTEWRATWPTIEDFKEGMPMFWSEKARELLPAGSKGDATSARCFS
jgi:hypothetical protein